MSESNGTDADRGDTPPATYSEDELKAAAEQAPGKYEYGHDEGQDYVDRDAIDFDPADGLYSGTAVDGTSDIPNPEDVVAEGGEGDKDDSSGNETADPSAHETTDPSAHESDDSSADESDTAPDASSASGGNDESHHPMPGPGTSAG